MPKVYPFKALRPHKEYVSRVSARSADFPDQSMLANEIRTNPFSFHHVTKNHINYSGAYQEPEKFLPFAAKFLEDLKNQGVLLHEGKEAYYYYVQRKLNGKVFKGIIGLVGVEDYRNNKIKKHEAIRPSRLRFLIELFKITKVLGEPTVLAHPESVRVETTEDDLIFEFESVDGKTHKVFRIADENRVTLINQQFERMENFYIADGHHRSASVNEFNVRFPELTHGMSMALLIQEDELEIQPFHRLIKPLSRIEEFDLIAKLERFFIVERIGIDLYTPDKKREFGLYINRNWYKLTYTQQTEDMDIEILENLVVKNIFNIQDSRVDSQISFHPYSLGDSVLKNLVDGGTYDMAFTSKACTFEEVRKISDLGHTLPAKSTYIEPKLRSGIIIQEF